MFGIWWSAAGIVLAFASGSTVRRGEAINYEAALKVLLVGIAAGLALYLVPDGLAGIGSADDVERRLLVALAIAWVAALFALRPSPRPAERPVVALAAYIGVNAPLLAFLVAAAMVCGDSTSCL